jgi:hypothetical protein
VSCLKNNIKIYMQIYIKTAPTCFDAVTSSSGSALLVLPKVTVVKKKGKGLPQQAWTGGFRVG